MILLFLSLFFPLSFPKGSFTYRKDVFLAFSIERGYADRFHKVCFSPRGYYFTRLEPLARKSVKKVEFPRILFVPVIFFSCSSLVDIVLFGIWNVRELQFQKDFSVCCQFGQWQKPCVVESTACDNSSAFSSYNSKDFCCFPKGINGHDLETQVITVFSNCSCVSFGVFVVLP